MKRWALVSGPRGAGKSSLASRLVDALRARGVHVAGVVQEAIVEGEERVGYVARRVTTPATPATVVIARKGVPREGDSVVCSFAFEAAAFAEVRGWLATDARPGGVVVIDEVSKLEVSGGGHHDAIVDALAAPALAVLVVRADQLFFVMDRFGLDEPVASLEATAADALEAFADALASAVASP